MCLGIPGQIIAITDASAALAQVAISGVQREVNLSCVLAEGADPAGLVGCWTLVHVGFAMSLLDEQEARHTLALLAELDEFGQMPGLIDSADQAEV